MGSKVVFCDKQKPMDLQKTKQAALRLSQSSEGERNAFLANLENELVRNAEKIVLANAKDVKEARAKGLATAFVERLVLDEKGVRHLAKKVGSVRKLKSGLGEVIGKKKHAGLTLTKVRVSLGVLLVIYEARPEVTIDVAALCIKSGNGANLKGGFEAVLTSRVLYPCIRSAFKKTGFSEDTVGFVEGGRDAVDELLKHHDVIDLVIARGSYGMVKSVTEKTKIPVLAHSAGGGGPYLGKRAKL